MCSIAYEKMPETSSTAPPPPVPILRRLRKVDVRVWFFVFIAATAAYDVTKLEYLLQWGVRRTTVYIFVELLIDVFLLHTAVTNTIWALKVIKVYGCAYLVALSMLAVMAPVWMVFDFDSGAPELTRLAMEHGFSHDMGFGQKVAYCALGQIFILFEVAYYAIQVFLARKVIRTIEMERKESCVEMNNLTLV